MLADNPESVARALERLAAMLRERAPEAASLQVEFGHIDVSSTRYVERIPDGSRRVRFEVSWGPGPWKTDTDDPGTT